MSEIQYSLMVSIDGKVVFSDTYEDSGQLQQALDTADEAVEEELNTEPQERIYDED